MSLESSIVEEVRRRRGDLSRQYGDDLDRYAAHLREIEAAHEARVVDQITVVRSASRALPADRPASE